MIDVLAAILRPAASLSAELKLSLGSAAGLSPDALHFQLGLIVLCVSALVMRRHPLSFGPWLVLLFLETGNELADLMLEGMGSYEATLRAGLHDLIYTMFAPTLLLLTNGIHQSAAARQKNLPAD